VAASEQFRPAPLVAVFDFGYEEIHRQVKARGTLRNKVSLERTLQLGISEELTKLDHNLNWLATTASVAPFIGCSEPWLSFGRLTSWARPAREPAGGWAGHFGCAAGDSSGLAAAIPAAFS
jgi:biopolymer transport protein TolQ